MKLTSRYVETVLLVFCIIFSLCFGSNCFADSKSFSVSFDAEAGIIGFKGSTGVSNELLSITLLPDGSKLLADEISNENSIIRTIRTGDSGAFDSELEIPDKLKSGAYVLHLKGMHSGYDNSYPLSYISKSESSKAFSEMKNCVDSENLASFKETLRSNSTVLGINPVKIDSSDIYTMILFNQAPENGYNIKSFYDTQRYASAVSDIKEINGNEAESLDKIITAYSEDLGADISYYKEISSDARTAFVRRIDEMNEIKLSKADPEMLYFETMFLSELDTAGNYSKFGEFLESYSDSIKLDMKKFNSSKLSSSGRNSVLKNMYGKKYMSVEEVKDNFSRQTALYVKETSAGGGGGSGRESSGNSGFMSANGITIPESNNAPENNNVPENTLQNVCYTDTANHWAKDYITGLSEKGIINGYGNNLFMPDKSVTRAEFTKLICESFGISESNETVFEDVKSTDWYSGYVCGAYKAGIVNGYNGRFNPNDLIKREDAAVIICNALNRSGESVYDCNATFFDLQNISDYALSSVAYLQNEGIMEGSEGFFNPKSDTTRAEAATLICRILKLEV